MPHHLPDRLLLASASPRRREMLARFGAAVQCMPADLDDASLHPRGAAPLPWAASMAWFKAARVAWLLRRDHGSAPDAAPIVAADTVCDLDGAILGKPADAASCRAMLEGFTGRAHLVHTGVCLLAVDARGHPRRRLIATDSAVVHLGPLSAAAIDAYVASGAWAGKAGGYNFSERVEAGWPLRCEGDPTTVMGLPMRRLAGWLAALDALGGPGVTGRPPAPGDAATCGEVACGCC